MDEHGQPPSAFNRGRRVKRSLDELMGLCKGIAADGKIVQEEAEFLLRWMRANAEISGEWPADRLLSRVGNMLCDGVLDEAEQKELLELIHSIYGLDGHGKVPVQNLSTTLPLDDPLPDIIFPERVFLFTGKFAFGPRASCIEVTTILGGVPAKGVSKKLDYLVVGIEASRDWKHTNFGNKILKAQEYRDQKSVPLSIVPEKHWLDQVEAAAQDADYI